MHFKTTVQSNWGTSLAVQWLRLHAPKAGGTGSIPGQGTKILQGAVKKKQKKKNPKLVLEGLVK